MYIIGNDIPTFGLNGLVPVTTAYLVDEVYTDVDKLTEEKFPRIVIQKIDEIDYPKLGNLLMPIISEAKDNQPNSIASQLNQLYNGEACIYLFESRGALAVTKCQVFWNGIIS